jgi:hypothetical protein
MDHLLDARTVSEIREICEGRGFTAAQYDLLCRNVAGAPHPNHRNRNPDFHLWVLAHILAAAVLCSRRRKTFNAYDCAIEILVTEKAAEWRQVLARNCGGHGGVRLTGEGLVIDTGVLTPKAFKARWRTIEDALASGHFMVMNHDRGLRIDEAVAALHGNPDPAAGARAAVSILSRQMRQWREERLLRDYRREFAAVTAFLTRRGRTGLTFDDDDIVAFWSEHIDRLSQRPQRGEDKRPMFATAVKLFRDIERYGTATAAARKACTPVNLDAVDAWMNLESGEGWNDAADELQEDRRLFAGLAKLPAVPKMLKGTERKLVRCLVVLWPFHKRRPLTILRLLSFGMVQSGIGNRLRRGGGGADVAARVACEDAMSYDQIAARFNGLAAHFQSLIRIAAALRYGDAAPGEDVDPALAEKLQQHAGIIQEGNADLERMRIRRAGFGQPRETLAAIFAEHHGMLSELGQVVQDFAKEVERLAKREALSDRFGKDMPVFSEILTRAYVAGQEPYSDVQ